MKVNTSQGDDAARVEELAGRVRAGQLPPPEERVRIRTAAHVTLEHFAQVLRVSQMTVSRWERGETEPSLDQRVAYARLLREVAAATGEASGV
ncbi:helix-turn-helix transcriptional regulator [Streptomyces sp. MB09-02B]|uniref:helix-turn-helix domain-containing protein n=1 Tax=Streptomyces sp. MB09-02B TaxID=3028667 RepID=UPI0029B5D82C|nr:helix-turn-helix transcriptional regulator [Streptomyces sp. MB09-02B]MDX3643234.1 helix-turn-helix transcriptional regulator [Streptomyces sp. MB09-02B]